MQHGRTSLFIIGFFLLLQVGIVYASDVFKDASPDQNHSTDMQRLLPSMSSDLKQIQGYGVLSVNTGSDGSDPGAWTKPQPYQTNVAACPSGFRAILRYAVLDTSFTAYQGSGIYFNSWRLQADRYQPICVKNGYYVLNLCGFAYFNVGESAYAKPVNTSYDIYCVPLQAGEQGDTSCSAPKDDNACEVTPAG